MKVDLNKNRIKEIKGKVITNKEVTQFNKLHPKYNLGKPDIIKIMRAFNNNIAEETMQNIYGVMLPENIGALYINNAGKPKNKSIDYAKSKELGKLVYHKNWETDNNIMRIVYINRTRKTFVKNTNLFSFKPLQQFKRNASAYFRKHWARCLKTGYMPTVEIKL
jgi:hypothetical protein